MKDVTQRNFTQPRGWIGTISYTIFLPEKTLANFYLEDGGSMKLCSSNCCAVWTLQQSPKNQNYGYQWFGALEYELLSLFAQYVVQEQQVLSAFSIFTQREYLQSKNVGMFPQLCMRQHSSSSAGSPLSAHQPLSLQKLYYTPEKELLLFFFPGSINFSRTKNRHRGERSWSVLAM